MNPELANSLLASLFATENKNGKKERSVLANSTNLQSKIVDSPQLDLSSLGSPRQKKPESDEDYSPTSMPQNVTKPIVTGNRRKIEWCQVCNLSLITNAGRSQGPRRHILKDHLMKKMFLCPFCDFGSNYDKAHVSAHMKKIHPGKSGEVLCLDRNAYADEEADWMEKCFGTKGKENSPEVAAAPTDDEKPPTPVQRKSKLTNRRMKSVNLPALAAPAPLPFYQNTLENFLEALYNGLKKFQEELDKS